MITNRLSYFKERKEPQKYEKFESVIKYRKHNEPKKKLYEYYKCDYCNAEIEIKDKSKRHETTGGAIVFPATIVKR